MNPLPLLACLALPIVAASLPPKTELPKDERPAFWKVLEKGVAKSGMQDDFDAALQHIASVPERRMGVLGRLECVNKGLVEPWAVPEIGERLEADLASPLNSKSGPDFEPLFPALSKWLDYDEADEPDSDEYDALDKLEELWTRVADSEVTGGDLLSTLSELMGASHAALDLALGDLNKMDRKVLFEGYLPFANAYYLNHDPKGKLTSEQQISLAGFTETLLQRPAHDRVVILAVAEVLSRLGHKSFTRTIKKRLGKFRNDTESPDVRNDVRAIVGDSPASRVVLTGKKTTTHKSASALVIDLGGNDAYTQAAQVTSEDRFASVVIDIAGDDTYGTPNKPGAVYALGGVAMLFDLEGNDVYIAGRGGQGSAILGFALLADFEGDDTYEMHDFGQGHSICGVGLLYDGAGNDTYKAWAYAQGGGIGNGISALIDGAGDDSYLADLKWPDVYGNSGPEIYHGASQGYNTGMRPQIPGGIAACIDLGEGADRYQSGNFSQAGGYYFGFGMLVDSGGDDENFGTRYSQGFGVHQGIALRRDRGGNDTYTCRSVAHCGMAWDEGVGYFIDEGGDDTYVVGDLGLGGAAQTGVAIFLDQGGKDTYRSGKEGQGGTGASEYHNKPSIGLFIDLGGDVDTFASTVPDDKRGDKACVLSEKVGVFLDTKEKTFKKALRDKGLK